MTPINLKIYLKAKFPQEQKRPNLAILDRNVNSLTSAKELVQVEHSCKKTLHPKDFTSEDSQLFEVEITQMLCKSFHTHTQNRNSFYKIGKAFI